MERPKHPVVIVSAMDRKRAIGRGLDIPWTLPDDFSRFKAITVGHPNIMGWNTALSLGRALPERRNIVISRTRPAPWAGMEVCTSLEQALDSAGEGLGEDGKIMVIGGSGVYAQAMPIVSSMRLTFVHGQFPGCDVFFPEWDRRQWRIDGWEHHGIDDRHAHAFDYVDLERISW